jgi:hypothetical protein
MPAPRVARAGLALVAALLLAGGIAGCGHAPNPFYRTGYDAGLIARQNFLNQYGPVVNDMTWLCSRAAYQDIQSMSNSAAMHWQEGFDTGCAKSST